ncbi:WD40-repeat-containing domain protein [Phlyctochytrium arcticum]|nr:WD40-repeat-containing domain protein [Phlyctochytrium arcticum]
MVVFRVPFLGTTAPAENASWAGAQQLEVNVAAFVKSRECGGVPTRPRRAKPTSEAPQISIHSAKTPSKLPMRRDSQPPKLFIRTSAPSPSSTASQATAVSGVSAVQHYVARSLPGTLNESLSLDTTGKDKAFASQWISDTHVVFGTKCNALIVANVVTGRQVRIPLVEDHVPGWGMEDHATSSANACEAAPSSGNESPSANAFPNPYCFTGNRNTPKPVNHGIRDIAVNPTKTLLAVGVGKPLGSIQVFRLPEFEPVSVLQEHADFVFSLKWINDTTLISGGRDGLLKAWHIPSSTDSSHESDASNTLFPLNGPNISILSSFRSVSGHRGKVRDVTFNMTAQSIGTLSTDGFVKIWEADRFQPHTSIALRYTEEACCLAVSDKDNLYAVGSANNISILDPRSSQVVQVLQSCDDGWGVRSLVWKDGVITIGGGKGRISFYDTHAKKYLSWEGEESIGTSHSSVVGSPVLNFSIRPPSATTLSASILSSPSTPSALTALLSNISSGFPFSPSRPASPSLAPVPHMRRTWSRGGSPSITADMPSSHTAWLQSSQGWLRQDEVYQTYFQGTDVRNSIYSLSYNPEGDKLFAAGGPLQANLQGCYASIWA